MRVGVPKETAEGERRVALSPDVARRLTTKDHEVVVEAGAGEAAGATARIAGATTVPGTFVAPGRLLVGVVTPAGAHRVGYVAGLAASAVL